MASPVNQKFTLWRAAPLEGEAVVLPSRALKSNRLSSVVLAVPNRAMN